MKRVLLTLTLFIAPFLSFSQSTEDFSDETFSGETITTNTGLIISSSNLDWSAYTNQLDYNNVLLSPPSPYITPSSNNDFFQITLSDQSKVFSSIEFDLWLNYGGMFGTGDMGCDCKSYTTENQLIETISKGSNEVAKNFIFNSGSIKKIICNPTNVEGGNNLHVDDIVFTIAQQENNNEILLNGSVSTENNQIKNLADPTDAQDAATKGYVDNNVNSFSGSYNDLTDKPTSFSGDLSGNVTSNFLKLNPLTQAEIDNLNPEAGTIVFNADSEKFIGYSGSAGHQLDQSQENQNELFDNPNTAQSFTAGSSGSLSKIDVKLSNGMYGQPDNNVTLTLRDGEGTDGDVLFSTGLSTSSSTAEWISVDISGVEITQGSKYTIHLTSTTSIDEAFMWARDNTNPYPNGKSFYSNTAYIDYDLCFKTYISTSGGWVDLN